MPRSRVCAVCRVHAVPANIVKTLQPHRRFLLWSIMLALDMVRQTAVATHWIMHPHVPAQVDPAALRFRSLWLRAKHGSAGRWLLADGV